MSNLLDKINKKHGKGTATLGSMIEKANVICSTGSYKLDYVLGCGGIPQGKIMELFGPNSSGKSTFSMIMMREMQKACPDLTVALLDFENSFDRDYAIKLGLNPEKILIVQPDFGEQGLDILDDMVTSSEVAFVVIDSVSAMVPQAEIAGEYTDSHIAQQARMMSQGLRKLNSSMVRAKTKTTLCWINQIRNKIGVIYGSPETTSAGEALKFYAHVRLRISRGKVIGEIEDPTGFETTIKVVKSKVGPPFKKAKTEIYTGKDGRFGIDFNAEMLDFAVQFNIVQKAGAWYSMGDDRLGQGKPNTVKYLVENPKLLEKINSAVQVEFNRENQLLLDNPIKNDKVVEVVEVVEENNVDVKEDVPKRRRGRPKKN